MEHEDVKVFLGPTLGLDEARNLLDADYLPPASRGDIYRASKTEPRTILLIDGAFESGAAALHNEILWALSNGITILGASSIGALRAAELAPFGMKGIGKIFEDYLNGSLARDDAVAVVHGPKELGYPLLSVALVDIWATLDRAFEDGKLSLDERALLRETAGGIFYKQLSFDVLLNNAVRLGLPAQRVATIRQDLASHFFSQKRTDAIKAIESVASEQVLPMPVLDSSFVFERTSAWENLVLELDEQDTIIEAGSPTISGETELAAIGLVLAEKEAQRRGFVLGRAELEDTARQFRRQNNLNTSSAVQRWMQLGQFEHDDYVSLVRDEYFTQHSRAVVERCRRNLVSRLNRHRRSSVALTRTR